MKGRAPKPETQKRACERAVGRGLLLGSAASATSRPSRFTVNGFRTAASRAVMSMAMHDR